MVPLNRMGSCRMMDKRDLRVCRGSLAMSISSMTILPVKEKGRFLQAEGSAASVGADVLPSNMSTMRKKAKEKEDFPLPVLPQIPT